MPLSIQDVLEKGDLEALCSSDFQYSRLVFLYQRLSRESCEKIETAGTSFLELLGDSDLELNSNIHEDGENPGTIREMIQKVLSQKISVGLIAVDEVSVSEVVGSILRMNSNFASDELILRVCRDNLQVTVKKTATGQVVTMSNPSGIGASWEKTVRPSDQASGCRNEERSADSVIQYLHKCQPKMLRALLPSPKYRDLLQIYRLWSGIWHRRNGREFIMWLLALSKHYKVSMYSDYEQSLHGVIAKKLHGLVQNSCRTISQLQDDFCHDKPNFIHQNTIKEIVMKFPRMLKISQNSVDKVGDQVVQNVTVALPSSSLPDNSMVGCSRVDVANPKSVDFNLPAEIKKRVIPLLTVRIPLNQILSVHNIVRDSAIITAMVEKYGCFLNYLVEMARACKPHKLSASDFDNYLKAIVVGHLIYKTGPIRNDFVGLKEEARRRFAPGVINDEFLRDAISVKSNDVNENSNDSSSGEDNQEDESVPEDPMAALESHRIIHLLTRQPPRFSDFSEAYASLPESAVEALTKSSVSLFEHTITLCKRLMPYDAEVYESNLHELVQSQVATLHVQEQTQMTIQHVHSLLCDHKPMLLSPNFIRWCLQQPGSAFCVYASWIYMHNASPGDSRVTPATNEADKCKDLINSIKACTTLHQIISILTRIPSQHAHEILGQEVSWYEFIENNMVRQERRKLVSLLLTEVNRVHGGNVNTLFNLRASFCSGFDRFISLEHLEEILRQHHDRYAMSNVGGERCYVALVRDIVNGVVRCVDRNEETFLERVLFCFPPKGYCDVSDILGLVNTGDEMQIDLHFLQCFFSAFPMLFCLVGDTAILTCKALDFKQQRYPTVSNIGKKESPRRIRSRSIRESRTGRSKRKRQATLHDGEEPDVVLISDDDECPPAAKSLKKEDYSVDADDPVKDAIEDLLPDLVADVAVSKLSASKEKDGRCSAIPLIHSLVSEVLSPDEAETVIGSNKHWLMFKKKIIDVIKADSRFKTTSIITKDGEVISEVAMAEASSDKEFTDLLEGSAQVEEVTSTTVSPLPVVYEPKSQARSDENSHAPAISHDGVIKLTPPRTEVLSDQESTNATEFYQRDTSYSRSDTVAARPATNDHDAQSDVSVTPTFTPTYTNDEPGPKSIPAPFPTYSLASGSSAYKYMQPPKKAEKDPKTAERNEKISSYVYEYVTMNNGACATRMLIESAYEKLKNERFARSRLAFEAFFFDFLTNNRGNAMYALSGAGNGVLGVSRVTLRYPRPSRSAEDAFRILWKLIPDLCQSCIDFMIHRNGTRVTIDELCVYVLEKFSARLPDFPDSELTYSVRCLLLVNMIRNLQLFCFAVGEPVVYLRDHKGNSAVRQSANSEMTATVKPIVKNRRLRQAVLLMAGIIRNHKPASSKKVRESWQREAPASIAKVFGTGISFTLALRSYAYLFPESEAGELSVNNELIALIKDGVKT